MVELGQYRSSGWHIIGDEKVGQLLHVLVISLCLMNDQVDWCNLPSGHPAATRAAPWGSPYGEPHGAQAAGLPIASAQKSICSQQVYFCCDFNDSTVEIEDLGPLQKDSRRNPVLFPDINAPFFLSLIHI